MENIAKLIPDLDVDPGSAYLVGLLHDIGRFVMFEHATSDLQIVDESDWQSPEALLEAEKGVFGYAHSELGGLACKHWGLPDAITQAVRRHHTFIEGEIKPSSSEAVLCINQIADRLSISVLESPDGGELNREQLACRIDQQCLQPIQIPLNFSANVLVENIDSIRSQSDQILSGLGFA